MPKTSSEIITFRADVALLKLIDEACKPHGFSRGTWVKHVVTEHLMSMNDLEGHLPPPTTDAALDELKQTILLAIARALFYVLTNPDGLSAEEANQVLLEKILQINKKP